MVRSVLGLARGLFRLSLATALACMQGCALFTPGVSDLRLVDVQPVRSAALDLHGGWQAAIVGGVRPDVVGRLTVETVVDLYALLQDSGLQLGADFVICNSGAEVMAMSDVFYDGVAVTYYYDEDDRSLYQDRAKSHIPGTPYRYDIYFDLSSTRNEPVGLGHPWLSEAYDLTRRPVEICLTIRFYSELFGFRSNTVRVPATLLRARLARPPDSQHTDRND